MDGETRPAGWPKALRTCAFGLVLIAIQVGLFAPLFFRAFQIASVRCGAYVTHLVAAATGALAF